MVNDTIETTLHGCFSKLVVPENTSARFLLRMLWGAAGGGMVLSKEAERGEDEQPPRAMAHSTLLSLFAKEACYIIVRRIIVDNRHIVCVVLPSLRQQNRTTSLAACCRFQSARARCRPDGQDNQVFPGPHERDGPQMKI